MAIDIVLCDTNILIHFYNDNQQTVETLDAICRSNIALPIVVILELYRGMSNKAQLAQMRKNVSHYDIVHLNEAIAAQAKYLMEQFKLSHELQIPDALIGETAVVTGIPLFTYNTKDFAFIPGISRYNY